MYMEEIYDKYLNRVKRLEAEGYTVVEQRCLENYGEMYFSRLKGVDDSNPRFVELSVQRATNDPRVPSDLRNSRDVFTYDEIVFDGYNNFVSVADHMVYCNIAKYYKPAWYVVPGVFRVSREIRSTREGNFETMLTYKLTSEKAVEIAMRLAKRTLRHCKTIKPKDIGGIYKVVSCNGDLSNPKTKKYVRYIIEVKGVEYTWMNGKRFGRA